MKQTLGGWWCEDLRREINLNIFLGLLAGVIFFAADAASQYFWPYVILKGLSLFTFIYHLAFSIILGKKAADKFYK